jgi:hypothetical protein
MYPSQHLLTNEQLSRSRMLRPQDIISEAYRQARLITALSRREQTRQMGNR